MTNRTAVWTLVILIGLVLVACGGSSARPERAGTNSPPSALPSELLPATPSLAPSKTFTPAPTQTPRSSTATPAVQVCSPLEDVALPELPGWVVNPFNPPPPGSDDPHQGVDLAELYAGNGMALAGRGVRTVLAGRVVGVMADRFPYGNALLVETPLEALPAGWAERLPTPMPTLPAPRPALTCPEGFSVGGEASQRSLYLLYAHMQALPQLQVGESVSCGQAIGAIGSSGNALNPHLHLEARGGPAAARFETLAHYDPSATLAEMASYCAWRVGGRFQALDPLSLLVPAVTGGFPKAWRR